MRVDEDVMRVLDRSRTDMNALVLPEQLDRKLYLRVAKVVELCGGHWHRKSKAHIFPVPAADALDLVLTTGEVVDVRKELQQFFTPPHLAARLCALAGVQEGDRVLEPSAGEGAIVSQLVALGAHVEAVEVHAPSFDRLFQEFATYATINLRLADFLAGDPAPVFDAAVMNPPFSKGQDCRHILRAREWLRPSGRLVAVASAGVAYRETAGAQAVRAAVASSGGSIEALPAGTFRPAGTEVNTVVVVINGNGRP